KRCFMFIDFIAANAPAIVAAVVLVPVLAFSIALFIEGARKTRWTVLRRAQPDQRVPSRRDAVGDDSPARPGARRRAAQYKEPSTATGGHGLRHGIAARRDHD